jgi:hypothetical protein
MKFTQYVLPVVAGAMAGMILISFGQQGMQLVYPMPAGTNINDKVGLGRAIAQMPMGAFVLLLANYCVCSFLAGIIATYVAKRVTGRPAIVVGIVLTLAGVANVVTIPHPLWFSIVSCLVYLPCSYLGYLVARKKAANMM